MLSQQDMTKIRKAAEEFVTLSNEMKYTAVDEKLRNLNTVVKKLLTKKDAKIEIFVTKGSD